MGLPSTQHDNEAVNFLGNSASGVFLVNSGFTQTEEPKPLISLINLISHRTQQHSFASEYPSPFLRSSFFHPEVPLFGPFHPRHD